MPELGEPISERELDVLSCMAEGASNREIADRLSISHNTVKVHVRNIFTKLGVSSRTEATTVALQKGMLTIPGIAPEPAPEELEDATLPHGDGADGAETNMGAVAEGAKSDLALAGGVGGRRRAAWGRRQSMALIAVLAVLVAALALNNLLRGNAQAPAATTATDGVSAEIFEETALGANWFASRTMPEARARMALATVGLNVYAIGGESEGGVDNTVLIYDSQQQQWREGAAKLTAVSGAAAGVLEGEIYVAGGYGANGEATTAVEAYSPLNNAWRPVTALPQPVAGALAVVGDGRLYLFGGENGESALDTSYVYDPGAQQWQALPPLPTPRSFAVGGALGDRFYVVGGGDDGQPLAVCEAYEAASEQWSDCPPLSQPRLAAGSAVFLNKLYVLGGALQVEVQYGELFDAAEQSWSTFEMPMLQQAADWPYLGVSNVENHIYAVGGEHGGQISDALYVYRPLVYTFFIPAASAGGGEE